MLTILVLMVGAVMVFVLILLAVVAAGIKKEPPADELTSQPANFVTAWVRRLLGVYVRKPERPPTFDTDREEPCLAARDPAQWPKGPIE
jgi:hypothetical protein